MHKRVKYHVIREVATDLSKEINELKNLINQLSFDIEKIKECYRGVDADLIIEKNKNAADYIKDFVNNVEIYNNYFEWISGAYNDTHNKAISELNKNKLEQAEISIIPTLNVDLGGDSNV